MYQPYSGPGAPAARTALYDGRVPRIWTISLVILVACLLASIVIGAVKLS